MAATFDTLEQGMQLVQDSTITASELSEAVTTKFISKMTNETQMRGFAKQGVQLASASPSAARVAGDMFGNLHATPVPGDSGAQLWKFVVKEIQNMYMSKEFTPMLLIVMARYLSKHPGDLSPIFPGPILDRIGYICKDARTVASWSAGKSEIIVMIMHDAGNLLEEWCGVENKEWMDKINTVMREVILSDFGTENSRATCLHLLELRAHQWDTLAIPTLAKWV